jgi:hypothetical protein
MHNCVLLEPGFIGLFYTGVSKSGLAMFLVSFIGFRHISISRERTDLCRATHVSAS